MSNKSIAFGGLFTSGIKSAYDIETSGWMKLSQGTDTAGTRTLGLATKNELLERINNMHLKKKLIGGNLFLQMVKTILYN